MISHYLHDNDHDDAIMRGASTGVGVVCAITPSRPRDLLAGRRRAMQLDDASRLQRTVGQRPVKAA